MKHTKHSVVMSILALSLAACADPPPPLTTCVAEGSARPLCGFQNPEDLAALPGGRWVIASEYGGMEGERSGALVLVDLEELSRQVLFDGSTELSAAEPTRGSDDCAGVPDERFSPHGIDLVERPDGSFELLAVQHGGRESVELFDVVTGGERPALVWRGCVVAPEGSMFNDVAGTSDGAFYVTHMMDRGGLGGPMAGYLMASMAGADSGHVYAWRPSTGFATQAGSPGPVPNGIELSPDESTLFVTYSGRGEVRRIDVASGEVTGSVDLDPLDNATWAPDGRLLVAASRATMSEGMSCSDLQSGQCAIPFAIVAVDPDSMELEERYVGGPGTPSGAGTVGLELEDGTLLVGTFAGDRVLVVSPAVGE